MSNHILYHLGIDLSRKIHAFENVRYVCVCGSDERARDIANLFASETSSDVIELGKSRFVVYKVLNVIVASHGMGAPSVSICLHELIKALQFAGNMSPDILFIRIGTSRGIGVPTGTIVCTSEACNEHLEPLYHCTFLGHDIQFPTHVDLEKAAILPGHVVFAKTMTANCFYEAQARLDGPFHYFAHQQQREFLSLLYLRGFRNIEMEAVPFTAIVHRAGFKAIVLCVTLVDRLGGGEYVDASANATTNATASLVHTAVSFVLNYDKNSLFSN